jgi:Uma2 family endonuclease
VSRRGPVLRPKNKPIPAFREEDAMASAARQTFPTAAEYLAAERVALEKHEYDAGRVVAMAGASRRHNLISVNLLSAIHSGLKDRPCEVYGGDMRVEVEDTGLYTYPDVAVVCGKPRFEDKELDTLLNPVVLIEILSPSTESADRGRKFAHYRRIESLREYVLVAQDRAFIERYTRQGQDWLLTELSHDDDVLRLASVEVEVPLREIYAKVRFGADESPDAVVTGS